MRIQSFIFLILAATCLAQTNVPSGMTYQGRLTNASNAPVPDGNGYEIEVRLWSTPVAGPTQVLLWGTRYTGVPLKSGAFNLILGSGGSPIPGATTTDLKAAFNTPTVHLGLTTTKSATGAPISSPTEILPRQQIFSTPFAFRSEEAASVRPNGVLSAAIKNGEVKTADIATGAVQSSLLADQSVTSLKIANGTILSEDIASESISPDRLSREFAIFVDEKPPETSGGTSVVGWQTRTLNTTSASSGTSITRIDNQISLQAGTYYIHVSAPSYGAGHHQAIFRRMSDDVAVIKGSTAISSSGSATAISDIEGYHTVPSGTETFDVYHYTQVARLNIGLGYALPFHSSAERIESSVFTRVHIIKIK